MTIDCWTLTSGEAAQRAASGAGGTPSKAAAPGGKHQRVFAANSREECEAWVEACAVHGAMRES